MTIHEYGQMNPRTLILLHPAGVFWDYFSYVIPLLEKDFHLIIPAFPGYNEAQPEEDFTDVESIAKELEDWLLQQGYAVPDGLYACSMGGSIALRLIADQERQGRPRILNAVIDGGITPYSYPWLVTRLIAVKDFLLVSMGKIGGMRLLERAFATDSYSKEDLKYISKVLRFLSFKTIWRSFESCNNYDMPNKVLRPQTRMQYWYAAAEKKERKKDLQFMRSHFPNAELVEMQGIGHAGMASKRPEELAERLRGLIEA